MKKFLAISFLLVFALSMFSGTDVNAQGPGAGDPGIVWDNKSIPTGSYCRIEKVGVCVVAQNEEDCAKISGEKVDSCSTNDMVEDKK